MHHLDEVDSGTFNFKDRKKRKKWENVQSFIESSLPPRASTAKKASRGCFPPIKALIASLLQSKELFGALKISQQSF